jgi:hypothetical protein
MPFASGPKLSYVGRGIYITDTPTEYVGATEVIHIPAGFRTDLASVPRLFWWLLPPTGAYENAATIHDAGCDELNRYRREMARYRRGERQDPPLPPQLDSPSVDGLFRRICRESGVSAPLRWTLWWGVRTGALTNPARRTGWLHPKDTPIWLALTAVNLAAAYGAWAFAAWTYGLLPWT